MRPGDHRVARVRSRHSLRPWVVGVGYRWNLYFLPRKASGELISSSFVYQNRAERTKPQLLPDSHSTPHCPATCQGRMDSMMSEGQCRCSTLWFRSSVWLQWPPQGELGGFRQSGLKPVLWTALLNLSYPSSRLLPCPFTSLQSGSQDSLN